MVYTNCLMVSQMKELDLFDDIEYKYIKNIIKHGDDDIRVEIEDVDCDGLGWCKTRFTFELNINVSGGSMPIMVDKEFVVEKEYNGSSIFALTLRNLDDGEEEEEEEEDEEDFPINIQVVGLGWCRYKTMEDVKRETTYCKNTLYKIKGDKTAYDMEGKYCETEDEDEEEEEEEEDEEEESV